MYMQVLSTGIYMYMQVKYSILAWATSHNFNFSFLLYYVKKMSVTFFYVYKKKNISVFCITLELLL